MKALTRVDSAFESHNGAIYMFNFNYNCVTSFFTAGLLYAILTEGTSCTCPSSCTCATSRPCGTAWAGRPRLSGWSRIPCRAWVARWTRGACAASVSRRTSGTLETRTLSVNGRLKVMVTRKGNSYHNISKIKLN